MMIFRSSLLENIICLSHKGSIMRNIPAILCGLIIALSGPAAAQTPADTTASRQRTLDIVATSHLDTQWRWTIQETINEFVPATFRENFKLMDLYPDYVFSFEGAFRYMLLHEYYPDEFRRLKKYIDNGQWRVAGSWITAVDVNMPSFESLVRHCLYGNGYFKKEFGKTSRDVMLPDCFGFGYTLPSIAAHCGLKSFSTQKLSWGSAFGVPFAIGEWEGVDGLSIIAALKPGAYVSKIRDDLSRDTTWIKAIDRQGDSSGLYAAYRYFGTGDTGGSPDSESVAWLDRSIKSGGPVTVKSVGSDDIADLVASHPDINLPRYRGELLMTRHGVGCYTSEAAMKRWNRKNELLASASERASVIADLLGAIKYPRDEIRENWIRFLWHQFHDDLTGTSIPEAYRFSWNDEILCLNRSAGILEGAVRGMASALDTRVGEEPLIIYNPLAVSREDIVEATIDFNNPAPEYVRVYDPDGKEVPSQIGARFEDSLTVVFLAHVPSVGYAVYDVRQSEDPCQISTGLSVSDTRLENGRYIVTLNRDGDVASIFDKSASRELLQKPIALQFLHDKPKQWPAWEIQYEDIIADPLPVAFSDVNIKVIENGPARVGLEITKKTDASSFRTRIYLSAGGAENRVDFDSDVDWYEKETLLKAAFSFMTPSDSVTYDLGLGTIKRGLDREKLYEVPAHQWADMTSPNNDYGVAVLNDCKYGWDHPDSGALRLTLIHTPGVYDNWSWVQDQRSQDMGHHCFAYAVAGHTGDWRDGRTAWEAARFNQPLLAFLAPSHNGQLGKTFSLLNVSDPGIMVTAVKMAENTDEVVVRMKELSGRSVDSVHINFAYPILSAREVNGVEDPIRDAGFSGSTLYASFSAYQPKTFAVRLERPTDPIKENSHYKPLALPYNLDGISTDADRADGDFDGEGNTLSGDLLPDTIYVQGIPFVTGPTDPGALNVVRCEGQEIALPEDNLHYDYFCLLATAVGGPALADFSFGNLHSGYRTQTWVQDYAEPLGQWNSRLAGDVFVESPEEIQPAYINSEPVGWVGTHRHTASGENEAYRFTYLYLLKVAIPRDVTSIPLPDNPRLRVVAATVADVHDFDLRPTQALYDVIDNTVAQIHVARTTFIDSMAVSLTSPIPGAAIHYTMDGTDPTAQSPIFASQQAPFWVASTTTVKARAVKTDADDSHVTSLKLTKLVPRPADHVTDETPGLRCRYYEGEWTKLPDFDSLTPVKDTVASIVAIPDYARDEDYGLVFTGYISVPREGLYDFFISSDDGSALLVGDTTYADNDGIHGEGEASLSIALSAGPHPITAWMFQSKGGEALSLSIQGPGIEKQQVSADMLFHTKAGR
jgi:alpha-mannosidase